MEINGQNNNKKLNKNKSDMLNMDIVKTEASINLRIYNSKLCTYCQKKEEKKVLKKYLHDIV